MKTSIKLGVLSLALFSSILLQPATFATSTSKSTSTQTSKSEKDTSKYKEIDYDKWQRDDKQVAYTKNVKIKGKVLQTGQFSDTSDKYLRVALNDDYDKVIFVNIKSKNYKDVIVDDDQIAVYGSANGRYTYESVLKSEITIPYMEADFYKLNDTILVEESKHFESKIHYEQEGIKIEQLTNDTFKLYNDSSQNIRFSVDSIDVDGEIVNSWSADNFYGELKPGQKRTAKFKNTDGLMKSGATVTMYVKILDDYYNTIAEFPISHKLTEDIKSKY